MTKKNAQRVVIIGGCGFIGHNLALELHREGHEVHLVDNLMVNNFLSLVGAYDNPNRDLYSAFLNERIGLVQQARIPIVVNDAREYHALSTTLSEIQPDVIIHLAAVAHANISNKDPYSTFDHSLRTLENALDWSRNTSLKHFIYFSSSMIYGNFAEGTVTEETPCDPLGIYGALKLSGEKMVIAYNRVFDMPYTIVRPSALYGERCVSRRVAQIFVENAIQGKPIVVNGDGSDRLDFTYISDLTQGISKIIDNKNSLNQTFNLTYGESRSIADLLEIVESYFPQLEVKFQEKDRFTPNRGTLSVDKARDLIGYNPEFPLKRGILNYVQWYKEFQELGLLQEPTKAFDSSSAPSLSARQLEDLKNS